MHWLIFALFAPLLYAVSNLIDEYFVNRVFTKVPALVFYTSLTNVLFLPLVFIFGFPEAIAKNEIIPYLIIGCIGVLYLFPYYRALAAGDTSVVVALFSLGKVFVPVLAFLFVGELLAPGQYLGFVLIVLSSALLTLTGTGIRIRFNASLYWMILCSFLLAIEMVMYKYVFTLTDWVSGFTYGTLFSVLFVLPMLLFGPYRRMVAERFRAYRKAFRLFAAEEFATFLANASYTYAVSLTAVSLVHAIDSFQAIFVLLYAVLAGRFLPGLFKERIGTGYIAKKVVLFACMILGVMLVV